MRIVEVLQTLYKRFGTAYESGRCHSAPPLACTTVSGRLGRQGAPAHVQELPPLRRRLRLDHEAGPNAPFYRDYRRRAAGGARGRVLEIGAGSGANLPYYPPDAALTAVDANMHMLRRLKAKAAKAGVEVAVRHLDAETLPFDDESFDTVVATLMLCSVDDQARALAEAMPRARPRRRDPLRRAREVRR